MKKIAILVAIIMLTAPLCLANGKAKKSAEDKRVEAATKAVNAAMKKHNCTFDVRMIISAQGAVPKLRIVPIAEPKKVNKK